MYFRDRRNFSWEECRSVDEKWIWGETLEPAHGLSGCPAEKAAFTPSWSETSDFYYLFSNIVWIFQVYLSTERHTGKMCVLEASLRLLKHKWEIKRNKNLGLVGGSRRKVDLRDIWKVKLIDFCCCWAVWYTCKEREKSRCPPYFYIESHWTVTLLVQRENGEPSKHGALELQHTSWESRRHSNCSSKIS